MVGKIYQQEVKCYWNDVGCGKGLRIDEEMAPISSSYTRTSHQGCDYFLSKKASDFTVVYAQTSL